MKSQILVTLTILCLLACNTKKEESNKMKSHDAHSQGHGITDDRTKELMAIHDSIMPAMGKLMDLKKKISNEIKYTDSLTAIKKSKILTDRKEKALQIQTQLEKADEEMMHWMHQYKADSLDKLDEEKAAVYVADQKQKIISVKNLMQKSIGDAQFFIQNK